MKYTNTKEVLVELLEQGASDDGAEVDALMERVDLDGGLRSGRQHPLRPFAGRPQTPQRLLVASDAHVLMLPYELTQTAFHHLIVDVRAAKVGVTGDGLDAEDNHAYVHARINVENSNVQCTAAKIQDQNVSPSLVTGILCKRWRRPSAR
jgi:hypothetical protein